MKKILCILMVAILGLLSFSSCKTGGGGEDKKYSSRPTKFEFSYYAGGNGDAWVTAVTEDYMDNIDTDVYIKVKKSSSNANSAVNITSGVGSLDLYQIESPMFEHKKYLTELTDILETQAYGENVKIKDKLTKDALDYYVQDGKYYQLPQTNMYGWNWVYNKTLLDATFGENAYTLPRTSDELFDLGKKCYEKGIYLTAVALADTQGGDYLPYSFNTWFSQMTGTEGYNNFYNGLIYDEAQGKYVLSDESPKLITDNGTAIREAYALAEKLCSKSDDVMYIHKDSVGMNYKDVDCLFYGGKYRSQNVPKIAMCYVGSWLENEIAPYIEEGAAFAQDVYAIKMPVASAIVSRCDTVKDDATLAKVIDYVDKKTTEKPVGISDKDIAIIEDARNMVPENICRQFVIPKKAKNIPAIKKFLTYLCSDRAQKLAAKVSKGVEILPYGYTPTDESLGITISPYLKSCMAIKAESNIVDVANLNKPFAQYVLTRWYYDKNSAAGGLDAGFFEGKSTSSAVIVDETYKYYASKWKLDIANYKLLMGIK